MFRISAFLKDTFGTTTIEYALIVAGISAMVIAVSNTLGAAIVIKLFMTGLIFFEGASP
jgi:Flp pilus assembly pilin Flp